MLKTHILKPLLCLQPSGVRLRKVAMNSGWPQAILHRQCGQICGFCLRQHVHAVCQILQLSSKMRRYISSAQISGCFHADHLYLNGSVCQDVKQNVLYWNLLRHCLCLCCATENIECFPGGTWRDYVYHYPHTQQWGLTINHYTANVQHFMDNE